MVHDAETGFAGRPLALRRRVLEVLDRRDRLTAEQIAGVSYRKQVRFDHDTRPSAAQLVAVRRALRRLAARGAVRAAGWHRRRKVWERAG